MAKLVRIGNSQGLRIPKALLDQLGWNGELLSFSVEDDTLTIKPERKAREGWEAAFAEMHRRGEDKLLMGDFPNEWDHTEWEW